MEPDAWAACIGLGLLLLWDGSRGDMAVMHLFGTPAGFAWRDSVLTSTVLHQGGRLLGWVVGLLWLLLAWRPNLWRGGPARGARWGWLAVAVACLLLVPAFKHASHTSCPWDLQEFGGLAQHLGHWAGFWQADGGTGRCFPAGHASAGFGFLAAWFAWRPVDPARARRWLVGALLSGLVLGLAQQWRGAHFMSHTLWSAWLCWNIAWAADALRAVLTREDEAGNLPLTGDVA
jgi:membrane-associated PAP2 superfamily phosphatase